MRDRTIAVATAVALAVAGCSPSTEQGERSRLGTKDDKKAAQQDKKKKDKKSAAEVAEGNVDEAVTDGSAPGVSEAAAPSLGDSDTPRSGIDPSLADASSRVEEPGSDAKKSGLPPSYAELLSAEIQGIGDDFRLTLTFDGDIPERLPEDTFMVMGLGVTGREEDEGFAFGITGDSKSWRPYSGSKGRGSEFPGTFEISGNQVIMVLPWSTVEGPRRFEWYANASWFAQVAGQSRYSFDPLPNKKAARFPS